MGLITGSLTQTRTIGNCLLSTLWVIGMMTAFVAAQSTLRIPKTLSTHDPSRLIEDNGSYYFFGSSNGISGWYTTDNGANWKTAGPLVSKLPADVLAAVPKSNGIGVWAPDVIYNNNTGLFNVYYAVPSTSGHGTATALLTSPTMDPAKAVWKDMGTVIVGHYGVSQYSSIDPCPFFDLEGNMWMSFGSAYIGNRTAAISVIELDKMTGLPLDGITGLRTPEQVHIVQGCGCEASAVQPHDGYYYLFWNTGGCCSGASSTYEIHMARSLNVTGPYDGNQIFVQSTSDQHGPGQIGFVTIAGEDYYSYHYYPNSGYSVLGLQPVTWTAEGWPKANPV